MQGKGFSPLKYKDSKSEIDLGSKAACCIEAKKKPLKVGVTAVSWGSYGHVAQLYPKVKLHKMSFELHSRAVPWKTYNSPYRSMDQCTGLRVRENSFLIRVVTLCNYIILPLKENAMNPKYIATNCKKLEMPRNICGTFSVSKKNTSSYQSFMCRSVSCYYDLSEYVSRSRNYLIQTLGSHFLFLRGKF